MRRFASIILALVMAVGWPAIAQQTSTSDTFAESLSKAALQSADISDFGTALERHILSEAAKNLREGKKASVTVTFNVLPYPKPAPAAPGKPVFSPDIDTCYQICPEGAGQTFLQCYINCSSPYRPPRPGR